MSDKNQQIEILNQRYDIVYNIVFLTNVLMNFYFSVLG